MPNLIRQLPEEFVIRLSKFALLIDAISRMPGGIVQLLFTTVDVEKYHSNTAKHMIRGHREFVEDLRKHVHLRNFGNIFFHLPNQVI